MTTSYLAIIIIINFPIFRRLNNVKSLSSTWWLKLAGYLFAGMTLLPDGETFAGRYFASWTFAENYIHHHIYPLYIIVFVIATLPLQFKYCDNVNFSIKWCR